MKKKHMILVPLVFLLMAFFAFPAMASTKIDELTLDITATLTSSDNLDVEAEVANDGCYIDEVTITNEPSGDWDEDTRPKLRITIGADDGYTFASGFTKSDVTLDNDDDTVSSVSRSSSKLYVTVSLRKISEIDSVDDDDDEDSDLEVYELSWDESYGGVACWEASDYAKKYQVRLYRDGSIVGSTYTTTKTYYNFCESFTKKGDYTFKVKAIHGSSEGSWYESDSQVVSASEAKTIYNNSSEADTYYKNGNTTSGSTGGSVGDAATNTNSGKWIRDNTGWWYLNSDNSYPRSTWKQINGTWYYFNPSGYIAENAWVAGANGTWYYCLSGGAMAKNQWVESNGSWYYLGDSGLMLTSQMVNGVYYVDKNGVWVQ